MKLYQIVAEGQRKHIGGRGSFSSQLVYVNEPSQEDIDKFVDSCCNSTDKANTISDLEKGTVQTRIVELTVVEKETM